MRAAALFLAALLCLGVAAADAEIKVISEEAGQDGESSGTYAILQDGRVVGLMQRYSSGGTPLRREMGRRAGPADDMPLPPHAERLVGLIRTRMEALAALHDQLVARCPYVRQMALARLQVAAAVAGLDVGGAAVLGREPEPLPTRLFGEPERPEYEEHAPGMPGHGPHTMMMARHELPLGAPQGMRFRTRKEFEAWAQANPAFPRPLGMRQGGVVGRPVEMFTRNPAFPRPMLLREGGAAGLPAGIAGPVAIADESGNRAPEPEVEPLPAVDFGPWALLQSTAEPAPVLEPEVDWRFRDDAGGLNWGLLTFLALSAACAAVWGAMLLQWCSYCSLRAQHAARACFISSGDARLAPLLHEGHLDFDATPAKEGLEYAAAHVPATTQNVTLLHYEPLK